MENQDANIEQESSPVQTDENAESSTESGDQTTQPAEGTAQKPVEKGIPFHEHPRWQQLIQERDKTREELQKTQQELQYIKGVVETQKPTVTLDDPYAHITDPETKRWYQDQDKRMRTIAQQEKSDLEKKLRSEFEQEKRVLYQQFGKVEANEFLKSHPDLKRDSDELKAIVKKAQVYTQSGMDYSEALNDAYRTVMFDKAQENKVDELKKQNQLKTQQKVQANLEIQQVSQQGLPDKNRNERL